MATPATLAQIGDIFAGWRGLGRFWFGAVGLIGLAIGTLQILGAPERAAVNMRPPNGDPPAQHDQAKKTEPAKRAAIPQRPGRDTPGPVNAPEPDLLQPAPGLPGARLPRVAEDGRIPMRTYAAPFDPGNLRPRVGILLAGIGLNEADSIAAIKSLPQGISLAVSPYAGKLDVLLAAARSAHDEYLLSIPMEPQGYPLNDPDDRHALMTSLPPSENQPRLFWALSRFAGYVGVTNALGQMAGERLSAQTDQMDAVLQEVASRGLLFIDARPDKPRLPLAWNRSADLLIDAEPADQDSLDARLDALSRLALDKGSALGLVALPRPKTLERLAAWANGLSAKGLALAPVSALARPPAQQDQDK